MNIVKHRTWGILLGKNHYDAFLTHLSKTRKRKGVNKFLIPHTRIHALMTQFYEFGYDKSKELLEISQALYERRGKFTEVKRPNDSSFYYIIYCSNKSKAPALLRRGDYIIGVELTNDSEIAVLELLRWKFEDSLCDDIYSVELKTLESNLRKLSKGGNKYIELYYSDDITDGLQTRIKSLLNGHFIKPIKNSIKVDDIEESVIINLTHKILIHKKDPKLMPKLNTTYIKEDICIL